MQTSTKRWIIGGGIILVGIVGIVGSLMLIMMFNTPFRSTLSYAEQELSAPSPAMGIAEDQVMRYEAKSQFYPPIEPSAGPTAADVDQKIIKTGNVNIVVEKVSETVSKLTELTEAARGFIQETSIQEQPDGTHSGYMTLRVPVEEFESTVEKIKELALFVESEHASGQDVTEQFTDIQARLRNAKAQEERYLEILEQADDVEDILAVERELSSIRAQIESLEGRVQYLENRTSYSTITVYLSEDADVVVPSKEFRPWQAIKNAANTLVNVIQQGIVGIIWIAIVGGGVLLPLAAIGALIWLLVRDRRSSSKKRR